MRAILKVFVIIILAITSTIASNDSTFVKTTEEKEVVYLLHGLGRGKSAMWLLDARLEDAGYLVERISYSSLNKAPDEIVDDVTSQINSSIDAYKSKIHFVGHSLGGLIIRAYLDSVKVANLGRVVLIGPPNHGTTFVDKYKDSWWLKILGATTLSLGTEESDFPNSIPEPYYPVGVIAGLSETFNNENAIPGDDDGIVPVESVKLDGMTDFIIIEASHAMLRYNKDVAEQTIEFLKNGKFSILKEENN